MTAAPRPRTLLTRARLTVLKASTGSNRFRALKTATDDAIRQVTRDQIINRSLMAVVTGQQKYVDAVNREILRMAPLGIPYIAEDQGRAAREVIPPVAIAYDWLHDMLPASTLPIARGALELWSDWIWPESNPARANAYAINNPADNYYHGWMLSTWLAGCSLLGESAKAEGYVTHALERWKNRIVPFFAADGAGGYLHEGTAYGAATHCRILWYLLAHWQTTGQNLFEDTDWIIDAFLCQEHLAAPDSRGRCPFGDQANDPKARLGDFDRGVMLAGMAMPPDNAPGEARAWLDSITPKATTQGINQWQEYLLYDDTFSAVMLYGPTTFYSPGPGFTSTRTSWAADAICLQTIAGGNWSNHQDAAGSFVLWRGGDLLVGKVGAWSESGIQHEAADGNCLTVDGRGQMIGQRAAKTLLSEQRDGYNYQRQDLARAYDYPSGGVLKKPLTSYYREFVFLPSGALIVRDVVQKANPQSVVKWDLNTHQGQGTSLIVEGGSTAFIQYVKPDDYVPAMIPVRLGAAGAVSSYRTEITATGSQPTDEFLAVLQPGPVGFTPQLVTRTDGGVRVGDDEFRWDSLGQLVYVDHRLTPLDHSLEELSAAVDAWKHSDKATGGPEEAGVIDGSRMVVSTAPPEEGKKNLAGEEGKQ